MTEITYKPELVKYLEDKILLLDTCVLVELGRCPELVDLIAQWRSKWQDEKGILLITADVYNEFIRNAKKRGVLERRKQLIRDLSICTFQGADAFCMTRAGEEFQIVLNSIKDQEMQQRRMIIEKGAPEYKASIIDERLLFLLSTKKLGAKSIVLLTSNYTDVPLCLFDNRGTITISDSAGVRTISAYTANSDSITAAIGRIKK